MIYDTLGNLENYRGMYPQVTRALEIIRDTDFSSMEDGTYKVDGFDFRYMLQSYTLTEVKDTAEAHKDFIDIQFIIAGTEMMGVAPLADMDEEVRARPEKDVWNYRGKLDWLTITKDRFVVFFPNDAHAPGSMPPDGPVDVRKCVFKIHV